ncbi:MAG: hypothetical protein A3I66_01400 [Burkholderiales bacterium RIFCSPLOWO2_02_FULL_57_36]|nr:MAG: hypothetical protein A3I66_01400 [Burkholderiales bacterium RIFCSPLOWO2_02_FULL_57_36]
MALVTCYDPQGVAHQKESVDARECVANCGFSLTLPKSQPVEPATEVRTEEVPVETVVQPVLESVVEAAVEPEPATRGRTQKKG